MKDDYVSYWKKFGTNDIKTYKSIPLDQIIVQHGEGKYGVTLAYKHLKEGIRSLTPNDPVSVIYLLEENKFLLTDGYHRFVESMLKKENNIMCMVDWKGFTLLYDVPKEERFIISEHLKKMLK